MASADCELELTIRNIAILTNYVEASRGAWSGVITAREARLDDEVGRNAGAGVWGGHFRAFDSYNPERKSRCRPAAGAADRHITDNRKLHDGWVISPGFFRQDDEEKPRPGQTIRMRQNASCAPEPLYDTPAPPLCFPVR
jgi:hypothetical protein